MMYLGSPGRMVGVKCPTRQRVGSSERYSFETTLEGRVKAQVVPLQRRVWDVELGQLTEPSEVATLQEFASGAWGKGPFWFVPADAPVVNMLTPDDTSMRTAESHHDPIDTPPMATPDGWAARSYLNDGNFVRLADYVPVLPGAQVTGSAYLRGSGGRVRIQFVDESHSPISLHNAPVATDQVQRMHVTATVPADAAYVQLWITSSITQVARPAITWTDQPYEYGEGQGCEKAVVHAVSRDVTKAWDNPKTGRWSSLSFTVQEVG